ncbi:hypothetical protein PPL_02960 [Heterostelium album PN500]|uniref:Uncharacterized protein n=1 Tax=Heterostelium pallidum (strain ATCC 26659 / Pp 5 / PN500) TaxID=670386 RepID=D3B3J2_HETP5|nr:hypothetical protein PPL_02960 [Heterostelium album PN500]EFA83890.1 hypothetical protein PPL_02960 [Heterostelium album PN500]|eukprot:XP_020436007.1 hypothetical protein PPL_02960 [Heterostelium album PN500]
MAILKYPTEFMTFNTLLSSPKMLKTNSSSIQSTLPLLNQITNSKFNFHLEILAQCLWLSSCCFLVKFYIWLGLIGLISISQVCSLNKDILSLTCCSFI